MRELVFELLLRGIKPAGAVLVALLVWFVAIGPVGATPSAELGILSFLFGGMMVLLVQEGPI
jgi:hypothetical protein